MAGKRQATSDLNHDNWDREEEPEDRGTFRTANEDELNKRVIKKAKRKLVPGTDAADGGTVTKSVFSGFSGFGKSTGATPTAGASPFSFLSKIPAAAAATSGIVSSSATTTSAAAPTFSFGSGSAISTPKTTSTTFSFGNTAATTTSSVTTVTKPTTDGTEKSSQYYGKLMGLNQAVSEWIKTHVDKNPLCILSPIFKEYEVYFKELEEEKNKQKLEEETKTTTTAEKITIATSAGGIGNFKFSPTTAPTSAITSTFGSAASSSETSAKTNGFSFGAKNANDSSAKPAAASPSFSFGLKTSTDPSVPTTDSTASAKTSGFTFGKPTSGDNTSAATAASKPFSFTPGAAPFSFGNIQPPAVATTTNKSEANEEEDDEPPKNEFKQVVEDDAVYSKKCKVFVKKDGNFVDKGVGTLYLKPVESSGKTQLIVRADTNLGNILVNLILSSAIPSQRMGKNNVMMVCVPTPDLEKPTSMLLRVKTGEEADELLANIDKYKK